MAMVVLVRRRVVILPDAAHMVVVTDLWLPYGGLEPGQAHAILAQPTVHVRTAVDGLPRTVPKDVHQERGHIEKRRTQELGGRVGCSTLLGQTTNALFQYPRKQEKGKHQEAPKAHALAAF